MRVAGMWDWRTAPAGAGVSLAQERQRWRVFTGMAARLRPAAWILGAALAIHAVALVIDWTSLASEQRALRRHMEAQFRAAFPEAVAVVDPALQMRRKLAEARHAAGLGDSGDLLPMLEQVGAGTKELPAGSVRIAVLRGRTDHARTHCNRRGRGAPRGGALASGGTEYRPRGHRATRGRRHGDHHGARVMKARVRRLWEARSPRERMVIAVLAAVLAVVLYVWLMQSAERARGQLRTSVTTLRAQAAVLERQAAEYARLRAIPTVTASSTELRALVQAQAGAAGVARAVQRIDAPDANQVQVILGAVVFADWLNWVAGLQVQQVRLDTCRIEALSTPGLVSVTATFTRTKP